MAAKYWRPKALASVLVVAIIASVSGAQAQSGWSSNTFQDLPAAKGTPSPPPLQIAGYWSGTIQDPEQGAGDLSVFFTESRGQKKSPLKGTWTITFPNGPDGEFTDIGTIIGSVTASSVALTLRSIKGDRLNGELVFASSEASEQSISGTFHFPRDKSTMEQYRFSRAPRRQRFSLTWPRTSSRRTS